MAAISAPPATVIDLMQNRARTLIYSTGLPPAALGAAIAALDIIESEPDYAALPVQKARAFTRAANLPAAESADRAGDDRRRRRRAARLGCWKDEGFLVVAIRPPTVPEGTARLRVTFNAAQPDDAIERLAGLVRNRI